MRRDASPVPHNLTTSQIVLASLCALYGAVYAVMAWQRYVTFHSGLDMSYYVRLVWGLARGRFDLPLVGAQNVLGLHFEPILAPFVGLHLLGVPIAAILLSTQALAVASSAIPAFRLASRAFGDERYGLLGAALALLYPTVTVATLHDFHPVTLALPLLLGTVDALDEGRMRRALALGGIALLCREDIALQLACLAIFEAYRSFGSTRRAALLLSGLLVSYFCVYVLVVQPRFVPSSGSFNLHFAPLGGHAIHSGKDLVSAAVSHPLELLARLATQDRLLYIPALFLPLGFLGLLAPRFALGALPIIGINLLSDFPKVRTVEAHYATAIAPFVIGSSLVGAGRLVRWARNRKVSGVPSSRVVVATTLTCLAVIAHVFHGSSPLAVLSPKWQQLHLLDPMNAEAIRAQLRAVPPDASVSAHPGLLSHLAERPRAVWLPEYGDGTAVDMELTIRAADQDLVSHQR